jgi:hypothetical protein
MFLLTLLAAAFAGIFVAFTLGGLLGGGNEGARWLPTMVIVMVSLFFLPIWYASFYIGYRDIFTDMQDAS